MNDTDVRDLLSRVADEVPATPVDPEPLLRRGYRRMARTAVVGALGIACAIVLVVGGVGLIRSSAPTTIPADEGQPTEPPTTGNSETTGPSVEQCVSGNTEVCFGPLQPGTYTSRRFEPAVTFTVTGVPPADWNNPYDAPGYFQLFAPGWSTDELADEPEDEPEGEYFYYHPGLSLFRDVRSVQGCRFNADPTVGTSARELADWVAAHPGVATTGSSPVEVGRLSGYQLDVSIAESWRKACGVVLFGERQIQVPLFIGRSDVKLHSGMPWATMRLILLDLPDGGNVLIAIDGEKVAVAMPVVRSFEFDLS